MENRVLHVDADREVLEETMPVLETNDIAVTPVSSAEEALELLETSPFDAVVAGTDVGSLDVVDLLGQIRNGAPRLPVLIYAETWDLGRASQAVTAGATELVFREHETDPSLALVSRLQAAIDREERDADRSDAAVEERYRRLVESAPAPIVIYDAQGTLAYANEAAARFANADAPEEIVGENAMAFVADEETDWVEDRIRRVIEERERVPRTELKFRALDGEERYAIDVSEPITYRGEPAGQTVLQDISELKRRERQLEENRRRLQTIIDNLPGMVYRSVTVEAPWPMTYVGGQVEELTGHATDAIEDGDVLWGEDVVLAEDLDDVEAAVVDAVEAGESFELTYRIATADGRVKHVWEKGEAIQEDGEVVALEGVIMDVTAQRERMRSLEAEEDYRRDLYEITTDDESVPMSRIEEMLRIGRERFGVELGFLAAVDEDRGRHEVVAAVGHHETIRPGAVAPLDRTYCRRVLEAEGAMGVNDAVAEGWEDDPAYIEYGLGCYIGSKIYVDGELYGTLCFADEEGREEPFDDADEMFIELLGLAVGHELGLMDETTGAA